MDWKKKLLTVAVASALTACGGGGSSSSSTPLSLSSGPSLSGSAVKGVIAGGLVTAYDANGTKLGTATTDSEGGYELTLPASYDGGPLRVEVTYQPNATMKCDVPAGCGPDADLDGTPDIAFGDSMPLTDGFKLKAVVPEVTGKSVSTHITALTDVAARLAEERSGTQLSKNAIKESISQVADLFNVAETVLTSSKPIDLTNEAQRNSASAEELRHAIESAMVLNAVMKNNPADIGAALADFADEVKHNNGDLTKIDDPATASKISRKDLLDAAKEFYSDSRLKDTLTKTLPELDDAIDQELAELADAKPGELTGAKASDTATSPEIVQTQKMIGDLRTLAYALGAQSSTGSDDLHALLNGSEAFANQLEMAGEVTGPAVQYLAEALGMAASAMAAAAGEYAEALEAGDPTPTAATYKGVNVAIVADANDPHTITLTISQTALNVDPDYQGTDGINLIDVSLGFDLSISGLQALLEESQGSATLGATLNGTLTGPTATLTLLQSADSPSSLKATVREVASEDIYWEEHLVKVDGSSDDWNTDWQPWWNGSNAVTDATGDSTSANPGTDITQMLYRSSLLQLGFAIELTDNPAYPHTTGADEARYEIQMELFEDASCTSRYGLGQDGNSIKGQADWYIARNKYKVGDHQTYLFALDDNTDSSVDINPDPSYTGIGLTNTKSGDLVEFLVPQAYFPAEVNGVLARARVRTKISGQNPENLDQTNYVCIPLRQHHSFVQSSRGETWGIAPSDLSLELNAKLEQQNVTDPVTFQGQFGIALTGLDYDDREERYETLVEGESSTDFQAGYRETESLRFGSFSFDLGGTFSQGDNRFNAYFSADLYGDHISASREAGDGFTETYDPDGNWLSSTWSPYSATQGTEGYVTFDALLSFEAVIAGYSNDPAKVQLSLARNGENSGSAGLSVDLGTEGKRLALNTKLARDSSGEVEVTTAVFSNQDGIKITLSEGSEGVTGTINKGAEKLGSVSETHGTLLFRLRNGENTQIETL